MSSIHMGAINFYMQEHFFTLADTIAPIFSVITKVWPRANRAVVTNNLIVIIKAVLIEGFLYYDIMSSEDTGDIRQYGKLYSGPAKKKNLSVAAGLEKCYRILCCFKNGRSPWKMY